MWMIHLSYGTTTTRHWKASWATSTSFDHSSDSQWREKTRTAYHFKSPNEKEPDQNRYIWKATHTWQYLNHASNHTGTTKRGILQEEVANIRKDLENIIQQSETNGATHKQQENKQLLRLPDVNGIWDKTKSLGKRRIWWKTICRTWSREKLHDLA